MKLLRILLSLFTIISLGCATIIKEDLEPLAIQSQPAGATVFNDKGERLCSTPCHLDLERGNSFKIKITKPGYVTETRKISGKSWDGWLWGNSAFLILFPFAIAYDFYTGYAYDFSPNDINIPLKKVPSPFL